MKCIDLILWTKKINNLEIFPIKSLIWFKYGLTMTYWITWILFYGKRNCRIYNICLEEHWRELLYWQGCPSVQSHGASTGRGFVCQIFHQRTVEKDRMTRRTTVFDNLARNDMDRSSSIGLFRFSLVEIETETPISFLVPDIWLPHNFDLRAPWNYEITREMKLSAFNLTFCIFFPRFCSLLLQENSSTPDESV